MQLEQIRELIQSEQQAVDDLIRSSLHSEVKLIEEVGHYIVNSGGKRLRPLIVLLMALACQYQGTQHISLAAIIEFIHTATLLHDDVVDASTLRRGHDTANAVWGDHSSVLVGDFLYSRAFQMMAELNHLGVMKMMADATNQISEGEVLQLLNAHNPDTSEAGYFKVIQYKTAKLFEAGCALSALIAEQNPVIQKAAADYGLLLGIAYQLVDDALDYSASCEDMGKNMGDDLAEGKPTLPLLHIIKTGTADQVTLVKDAIKHGRLENLTQIQTAMAQTGSIEYTLNKARQYANDAINTLEGFDNTPYKTALIGLANFIVERRA
jgi:octaprenyl-diphosphate synthase